MLLAERRLEQEQDGRNLVNGQGEIKDTDMHDA